jgi:hypothetical protein
MDNDNNDNCNLTNKTDTLISSGNAWLEIDKQMTYDVATNDVNDNHLVTCQDWIWFDVTGPFGVCMCINSNDTHQYLGDTLQLLLDHAVVNAAEGTYTLTNHIVIHGNIGKHIETPWSKAFSQFSQFAEWGYHVLPEEEYRNVHRIRTENKTLSDLIKAGIRFSHIIHVGEERVGIKR